MGLVAIYQRPNTSKAAAEHKIYPYLLGGIAIERVNQVWCSDVTYIPMVKGFLYLVVVMDWVSRAVLAWPGASLPGGSRARSSSLAPGPKRRPHYPRRWQVRRSSDSEGSASVLKTAAHRLRSGARNSVMADGRARPAPPLAEDASDGRRVADQYQSGARRSCPRARPGAGLRRNGARVRKPSTAGRKRAQPISSFGKTGSVGLLGENPGSRAGVRKCGGFGGNPLSHARAEFFSCSRPQAPATLSETMAGSPLKRQRRLGVRLEDGRSSASIRRAKFCHGR
jgi:hypothetical protein